MLDVGPDSYRIGCSASLQRSAETHYIFLPEQLGLFIKKSAIVWTLYYYNFRETITDEIPAAFIYPH